jgi:hypothetical protein
MPADQQLHTLKRNVSAKLGEAWRGLKTGSDLGQHCRSSLASFASYDALADFLRTCRALASKTWEPHDRAARPTRCG